MLILAFPGLTGDEAEFVSFLKAGQARFAPNIISINRELTSR